MNRVFSVVIIPFEPFLLICHYPECYNENNVAWESRGLITDNLGGWFLQFLLAVLSIGAISWRRREMKGVHSLSEPPTLQADTHLMGRYASRKWQALASRWPDKWGWHWYLHWWSCHLRCHIFLEELERQTNTQRWDSVSIRHCWNTLEYSLNLFYGWLVLSDLEYGPISLVYLESLLSWGLCFENS